MLSGRNWLYVEVVSVGDTVGNHSSNGLGRASK